MKTIAKRFVSDESGATAIEYGLIAALMAVALIAIFGALRSDLSASFVKIGNTVKNGTSGF